MRLQTAREGIQRRPILLLIAEPGLYRRMSGDIEAEGIRVVPSFALTSEPIHAWRPFGDESAIENLKTLLGSFREKYSDQGRLMLHPGISDWCGFPDLPGICSSMSIDVVSAQTKVLSLFRNRLNFLDMASKAGIPNLVLSFEPLSGRREVLNALRERQAEVARNAFPVAARSVLGSGGGVGISLIRGMEDIEKVEYEIWLEELKKNCGDAIVYLEKYLAGARQIEVPFARFRDGSIRFFTPVDLTLRFRRHRLLESCPPQSLDPSSFEKLKVWSQQLLEKSQFVGVGSLEFLQEGDRSHILKGNPGLTGSYFLWQKFEKESAIHWQLAALSESSGKEKIESPRKVGHKVEVQVRIYAEDCLHDIPSPGLIHEWRDSTLETKLSQSELSPWIEAEQVVELDSSGWLGLISTFSNRRDYWVHSLESIRTSLEKVGFVGTSILNDRAIREILAHPFVTLNAIHSSFLDDEFIPDWSLSPELSQTLVNLCSYTDSGKSQEWWLEGKKYKGDASSLQWLEAPVFTTPSTVKKKVMMGRIQWKQTGRVLKIKTGSVQTPTWLYASVVELSEGVFLGRIGNSAHLLRRAKDREQKTTGSFSLFAQCRGRIHSLRYLPGNKIAARQPMVFLESLRRLIPHRVPVQARIQKWSIIPGQIVEMGSELCRFEVASD